MLKRERKILLYSNRAMSSKFSRSEKRSARLPRDEIAAKFLVFALLAINFVSNVDAIRTKNVYPSGSWPVLGATKGFVMKRGAAAANP